MGLIEARTFGLMVKMIRIILMAFMAYSMRPNHQLSMMNSWNGHSAYGACVCVSHAQIQSINPNWPGAMGNGLIRGEDP